MTELDQVKLMLNRINCEYKEDELYVTQQYYDNVNINYPKEDLISLHIENSVSKLS